MWLWHAVNVVFSTPIARWYVVRDDHIQVVDIGGRVHQVGGSLYMDHTYVEDSGRYTCVVNNSVGTERVSTTLTVSGRCFHTSTFLFSTIEIFYI